MIAIAIILIAQKGGSMNIETVLEWGRKNAKCNKAKAKAGEFGHTEVEAWRRELRQLFRSGAIIGDTRRGYVVYLPDGEAVGLAKYRNCGFRPFYFKVSLSIPFNGEPVAPTGDIGPDDCGLVAGVDY
jgi:hypothetical protein